MKWCVEWTFETNGDTTTSYYFKNTRAEARHSRDVMREAVGGHDGKFTIYKVSFLPRISEMAGQDNKCMLFTKVR